jgi:hypothetical protein
MPLDQFRSFLSAGVHSIADAAEDVVSNTLRAFTEARSLTLNVHTPLLGRPEIIFLPGLPGSVLETLSGDLVWFSAARAIAGSLGKDLDLSPPVGGPVALNAGDLFPGIYDVADLAWRAAGFRVHRFPFDWRKPLREAALNLRELVTKRKAEQPGVRFLPVAHSQGGLVVCEYARLFPDFAADFGRAVFLGTPFHGTYSALDATLGTADFLDHIKRLVDLGGGNGAAVVADSRRACCHMQGLCELLPDANEFQNTDGLYDAANYPAGFQPTQSLLDLGKNFKVGLLNPTLLGRSTVIMSRSFPTAANDRLNAGVRTPGPMQPGDGTTTLGSGLPAGIFEAFEARLQHLWLPIDSEVIQCVIEIGVVGNVDRSRHTPLTVSRAPVAAPVTESVERFADMQEMAHRFRRGMPRLDDVLWLFSK